MPGESKAARKKPYDRPSLVVLDANIARAKLKAMGDPKDANVRKMLSFSESSLTGKKLNHIRSPGLLTAPTR